MGVILLCASPASALHWIFDHRICDFELVALPELLANLPIPIGCEVIDCCPGCPGPGPIEWRVNVRGKVLEQVSFEFEGLPQDAKIRVDGRGSFEQGVLRLAPGETRVTGFMSPKADRVAFARTRLRSGEGLRKEAESRLSAAGARDEADDEEGFIEIEQRLGGFVVNTFLARFDLRYCPRPPAPSSDEIRLTSNTASDSAVILTDYRLAAACQDDRIFRTAGTALIGNALTNGTCNSEVSVFSDSNAMAFDTPVTTWTNAAGDEHVVALQPILDVPLNIWVSRADNFATRLAVAIDILNTNLLYNQNNVGVRFTATVNNVSDDANAVATIGNGCANAGGVQGSAWYVASELNIYYVPSAFTGVNCGADRNINYIGTTSNLGSLPHEIGHAYGLRPSASNGHTDGVAGFTNQNIMWGGGPGTRNRFTVGQAFRLNVHDGSMLNANGDRAGTTRSCAPNVTSPTCPALNLDSLPH
jgi:hypothetical protein